MSCVGGLILQWGSTIKVSKELPVATRHRLDTTEKLLKATLNPNKQQQRIVNWAASWQNQQNGMCAQRRLRSAWASAQSDQSLRCAFSWLLRTQSFLVRTAKTQIRLGGCPGWSESSLGAHAILLVLSWGGPFIVSAIKDDYSSTEMYNKDFNPNSESEAIHFVSSKLASTLIRYEERGN